MTVYTSEKGSTELVLNNFDAIFIKRHQRVPLLFVLLFQLASDFSFYQGQFIFHERGFYSLSGEVVQRLPWREFGNPTGETQRSVQNSRLMTTQRQHIVVSHLCPNGRILAHAVISGEAQGRASFVRIAAPNPAPYL
jgi:hypothetical protein